MIKLINNLFSFLLLSLIGNCFLFSNVVTLDVAKLWQIGFQAPATPLMEGIINFHNYIMFFLVGVSVFVMWLLARCLYLYNAKTNNNPIDNFTHATTVEIVWTIFPAIILLVMVIFNPSFLENGVECSGGSGGSDTPREEQPSISYSQVQRNLAEAEASRTRCIERLEQERYLTAAESRIKAASETRTIPSSAEITVGQRSDATSGLVNVAATGAHGAIAGALAMKGSGGSNKASLGAAGLGALGNILGNAAADEIKKHG